MPEFVASSVTIVLPAYNAAGIVGESVARLRAELDLLEIDALEIVVVDDGSRDGTAAEAKKAGADAVIEFDRNRGKGAAVRAGVLAASGEIVVFADVDLSYGPEVIQEAIVAVREGAAVCVGQRRVDTGTAIRKVGSRLIKWCTRRLLGEDYDTQCGIKAFEGEQAKQIFSVVGMNRFAFDIEIFFIMKSWGVRFETIDVVAEKREASTVRAMRDGFDTLRDTMRIARRARRGAYERRHRAQPFEAVLEKVVKSYDIRGIVPDELNTELAGRFGAAFAQLWREKDPAVRQVLCGRDMRASGEGLSQAFMKQVEGQGMDVIDLGIISTDMLYFASGWLDVPGVVFTASHNPAAYNGIKACHRGAVPIGMGTGLERVKELAHGFDSKEPRTVSEGKTSEGITTHRDVLSEFVGHAHSFVDLDSLKSLKVVVDCANGMGGLVSPVVLEGLPFVVDFLYPELDGTFPNHPADPLDAGNLVDLQERVRQLGADAGIAFDGDGDRVFFVDDQAVALSGSTALGILATSVLARHPGATVLYSAVCSRAVPEIITELGGKAVCTRVGHSHIKKQMAETQAAFGGEHSGHFYFARNYRADSGIIAALVLLEHICTTGQPLSQLRKVCERYAASGENNISVPNPSKVVEHLAETYSNYPQERIDGLTVDAGNWWFNVRPSNTEPLLRINVEAKTPKECNAQLSDITNRIKEVPK